MISTFTYCSPIIRKHEVEHDFEAYAKSDHETWQLATDHLLSELQDRCCVPYHEAFANVGLVNTQIPKLEEINAALSKYRWHSILIDSFIPPQDFMSLHANSVIPITRQIRNRSQLDYTPIPDIIHEAAGHLPMLCDPMYRQFLRRLGEVGSEAEYSRIDREVYEEHKALAELLGSANPDPSEVKRRSHTLANLKGLQVTTTSTANMIARFHWWTVEYGLIGPDHKIFGAGLLSSAKEASTIDSVPLERLSLDCLDLDFDITRPQPLLFVADDWNHLNAVLDQLQAVITQERLHTV